jgi:hypothetical protein
VSIKETIMNTTELKKTKQTMYTTNMKDTYEKIQALLTEQLQTPDPMTYKEFYTELMKLRQELRKR